MTGIRYRLGESYSLALGYRYWSFEENTALDGDAHTFELGLTWNLHKPRIADNVFTLNAQEEAGGDVLMTIRVAKHRTGKAKFSVGPYPAEYERGRVAPSSVLDGSDPALWSAIF